MDEHQSSTESSENRASSTMTTSKNSSGSSLAIPLAIIVGFGMIASAIYFGGQKTPLAVEKQQQGQAVEEATPISGITAEDHVRGNPNAPIVIVEYSDFDCPFCKSFHATMNTVMDRYAADGKVAWVYRHFPIENLHPSAPYIAAASECAAELGGNETFWAFSDLVFGERETNAMTDTSRLPEFATAVGLDSAAFKECLESERTVPLVAADLSEGVNAGVRGTPFSFILIAGQQLPVNGAQQVDYMSANIDNLIEQLDAAEAAEGALEAEAE